MTDSADTAAPAVTAPAITDKGLALVTYFLFFVFPIVSLIIAYIKRSEADEALKTHYTFQIRTFWISMLFSVIAMLLTAVVIGAFLFPLIGIWYLVRTIKGLLALNDGKPIANPQSWLFG